MHTSSLLLVSAFAAIFCVTIRAEDLPQKEHFEAMLHPACEAKKCRAVMVVLAGANGDASAYLKEKAWVSFAQSNAIALVAVTFRSPVADLKQGHGYYDARSGSGLKLSAFLDSVGLGRLPLFVYGFSGGAHFAASFAEHFPSRVTAWCAASAGWWQDLSQIGGERPPGIVVCGTEDSRYGACLSHFHDGRAAARRWTWVAVPGLGHSRSAALEDFVRAYFLEILKQQGLRRVDGGVWANAITGERGDRQPKAEDANSVWLPSEELLLRWRNLTGRDKVEILRRTMRAKPTAQPVLTVFLRTRRNEVPRGVLCLSLLANSPDDIPAKIVTGNVASEVGRMVAFAESNKFAVVAWGGGGCAASVESTQKLDRSHATRGAHGRSCI